MGAASAKVYFDDGDLRWTTYWGTCDLLCTALWRTQDEMMAHWKESKYDVPCEHEPEHVLIESHYGSGTFWHGQACRKCDTFLGPAYYGYPEYEGEYVPYYKTEQEARAATPALNP